MPAKKGSYILVLDLAEEKPLTVGRLGTFRFPTGLYLYCGSALSGLETRIRRHLRQDKKLHWHIDYLGAAAETREVWWCAGEERLECIWAGAVADRGGELVVRGFGSSDCRCPTHLLRIENGAMIDSIRRALMSEVAAARHGIWQNRENENSRAFQLRESTWPA